MESVHQVGLWLGQADKLGKHFKTNQFSELNLFSWKIKMSETLQEVLKSKDVELIRRARSTYKGKLARATRSLEDELRKDNNGVFVIDEIDQSEIDSIMSAVQKAKDIVEELHVRYTLLRSPMDGSEEEKLQKVDEDYSDSLEKSHRNAVKVFNAFKAQLKAKEKLIMEEELLVSRRTQYLDKLRRFKAKVSEYESAYQEAIIVVDSTDEFVQRTATLQKDLLSKEYSELLNMGQDLLSLAENVSDVNSSDQELFQCTKEKLTYRKTLTSLEKVIKKFEVEDKEKLVKLAPAHILNEGVSSSAIIGHTKASNILKIKVSAPKFSGKSRDFAVFKRDFNTIVAVDHRNDVEIGALLKESIPEGYKYLLDKYDLGEHAKMMDTLTQKFGRPRIIIDECTAEIKKTKKLTTDHDFIKFVEQLDKLKRDLSQLNLLSDIANTTVISEIEKKLPDIVQRDWIKLASSKLMADKPSNEVFEHLLEFLEETKRQAEYFGTEVRQVSTNQARASTKLGFVSCGVTECGSLTSSSNKVQKPHKGRDPLLCLACGDGLTDLDAAIHSTYTCDVWRSLNLNQKREKVKCIYHPAKGLNCNHTTEECKVGKARCDICKEQNSTGHHTWFCNQVTAKTMPT